MSNDKPFECQNIEQKVFGATPLSLTASLLLFARKPLNEFGMRLTKRLQVINCVVNPVTRPESQRDRVPNYGETLWPLRIGQESRCDAKDVGPPRRPRLH